MAQPSSSSMPRAGRDTSFLSFNDAPDLPALPQPANSFAAPSLSTNASTSWHHGPASLDSQIPVKPSSSSRASPSKPSRFLRSRPSSSQDLATAALSDAGHASTPSESPQSSPSRAGAKAASSRGSRLGALLARSLPSHDSAHARNASSSSTTHAHTETASSADSGFFGRRTRSKAFAASVDVHPASQPGASASIDTTQTLVATHSSQDATRSVSALGMLDYRPDPSNSDANSLMRDTTVSKRRLARPSSQQNLLDSFAASSHTDSILRASSSSSSSSTAAPQQFRGGRLGRLAYKKDDSIAFIAQSRNASHRMTAGTRSSSLQGTDYAHQQPDERFQPSVHGTTRGLGIDDVAAPHTSTSSTRRYQDADHSVESDNAVGVASSRFDPPATASSSNASSRAPSAAGSHAANYHNRFSRQGLSQELAMDPSRESDSQPTQPSNETAASAAHSARTSCERSSASPRGILSDSAIAALGAMPGASASSLLNTNGAPLSSKNILTIALQKAQNAVQLDSANNVPEAIAAYKQAVRLLEEVMERIAPRNGKRSRPSREEERRRLRVIHDTYADRIRLLSMIYSPEPDGHDETTDTSFSSNQQLASTKPDWLDRVRVHSQEDPAEITPRTKDDLLDANMQRSPRDDTQSFLSLTPVGTAFAATSPPPNVNAAPLTRSQHPFPGSPPMPNAPLSPLSPASNTSPRRPVGEFARPGSRESHRSHASVSLSIADEQEAQGYRLPPPVIAEETSRVSVDDPVPSAADRMASSSPKKEALRDASTRVREEDALTQQHGRSDSDSSYKSSTTTSRLKASNLPPRVFGLDDEVRTPSTPYFDAPAEATRVVPLADRASSVVSPAGSFVRQRNVSMTSVPRIPLELAAAAAERPVEKPVKMNLAQRARALSFKGPLLRQKASMPSLGVSKKEDAANENGAAVPAIPTGRPGSADSISVEPQADHNTPLDVQTSSTITIRPGSNRPRASTASALVSASTSAGTISQRRKNSQVGERVMQCLSDELEELSLMEDVDAKSMSRQRSTSQPGSRRPSIPTAFVSANASASGGALPATLGGGANGHHLPPPVPDLARTLSALELKRVVDTHAAGKVGGADASFSTTNVGDISISTLAMPLPKPLLVDGLAGEDKRDDMATDGLLITDIFPSGLPSLAAGAPSYASGMHTGRALSASIRVAAHPLLRPFCVMDQLRLSIVSGAQITERLYVSRDMWRQAGVKLVSVETKVRAIEVLLSALETVEKVGEALLMPLGSGAGLETSNASRFVKCLDEWEVVLVEVQGNLCKKLPFLEAAGREALVGAKSKFTSGFGSRFTRGLDRMTGGAGQAKTLDSSSMGVYVDALVKLFAKAGVLETHLRWLLVADGSVEALANATVATRTNADQPLASPTSAIGQAHTNRTAYSALPSTLRSSILAKLAKSGVFFNNIVLAWVLNDLALLVHRAVSPKTPRPSSAWFD